MNELYELKEKLKKELGEYSQNGKYSKEDSEVMKNLSGTIDHICNIIEKAEEEGYSGHYPYWMGGAYADGNMNGDMGENRSYRGRSYAGRRNARRDNMGRYSGDGYSRDGGMVEELRELMQDAPDERTRQEFQRFIQKIENM